LDYIFVDRSTFEVVRAAPMPEESILSEQTALPSSVFASDHISLAADIAFKR
jgi:mRNA deadenylase 3'-5' endonuclease subunit Ccr4